MGPWGIVVPFLHKYQSRRHELISNREYFSTTTVSRIAMASLFDPSGPELIITMWNWVNTMGAEALALCITKPSAAMVLIRPMSPPRNDLN